MRITGFLDFNGSELETQIEVAKQLNIKNLLLRTIDDKPITELNEEDLKEVNLQIRKERLNILALDPLIKEYSLYDLDSYYLAYENYKKTIDIAKSLRVSYIYLRLPILADIIDDFPSLEKQLTPIINYATKASVTLLMYPHNIKSNVMVYLMKHYKTRYLSPIFNPKQHMINKESPTVAYRLLKRDVKFFMAADIDKKNNPELLGYGRLKIVDMFKRLNRDKYNGYIILDDAFNDFLTGEIKTERPWYKRLFKRKTTLIDEYLQRYQARIYPEDPEKNVDIIDIYLNQIQVLNVVFKLGR